MLKSELDGNEDMGYRGRAADWGFRIEVKDISLTDYINVSHAVYVRESPNSLTQVEHPTNHVFLAHTAGRYAKKQFAKGRMPIVERLVNSYVRNLGMEELG
jgi:hypothetical protein